MSDTLVEHADPVTGVRFHFPAVTPDGQIVRVEREVRGSGVRRYHVLSEDRAAVYFELRSYEAGRTPAEDWELLRAHLVATYEGLEHTELTEAELNGRPALTARFRWPGKQRVLYYLVVDEALARFIYNPDSPLNEVILATVTVE